MIHARVCTANSHHNAASSRACAVAWLAAAVIAAALTGCGDDASNRIPVYETSGKISLEGQVPDGALVVLHPKDASAGALMPIAKVQPDGSFQVTTYETGDGAPVGQYVLTVSWSRAVQSGGDFIPGPELIPPKYANPQTSDLVVNVAEGQNELQPIVLRR